MNDVNAEIKEKLEALRELLQVEANLTMTPQKSNVTPVTVRQREILLMSMLINNYLLLLGCTM